MVSAARNADPEVGCSGRRRSLFGRRPHRDGLNLVMSSSFRSRSVSSGSNWYSF